MNQIEDIKLVKSFKAGEKKAFDRIYEKYKKVILNYLYRVMNSKEAAEDLTQETLIKVYMNICKYRPTGSFSSWVYAIARNLSKNEFRRMNRKKTISLETDIPGTEGLKLGDVVKSDDFDTEKKLEKKAVHSRMETILAGLPLKYREVITLCIIQKLPYEEAARVLKCSRSNVAIRLYRARKVFMELMKREKDEV